METSRAEAAEAAAASQIPELERRIVIKENQISFLLGQNPAPVARNTTLLEQSMPPEVPVGLPSALLERRPDVLLAEQLLRSASAQIGVAEANFFPQISLTGFFGKVSTDLSDFTSGKASSWSLAANLTGPIFQGGAISAQYRQAQAVWDQVRLQYLETALIAFREVSDALISREKLAEASAQWSRSVDAYQESVQVATDRYMTGKANYFEVLDAQQLLYPAQKSLAETELDRYLAVVQLYRALGGGWQLTDQQFSTQSTETTTSDHDPDSSASKAQ
jgi:multidrug efflux system outer membrane protein